MEGKGQSTGRVLTYGSAEDICTLNLQLRTAERVLLGIGKFDAPDFDALFEQTKELPWERWIPREFAFPVDGRSHKSQLSSVPAVQRTVKKAIVERLFAAHRTHDLPETGPIVRVEVAILDNVATLTIDTSGDGLHKRGYRTHYGQASLRETLAAAIVMLSTWRDGRVLWDPFCGSGTIAIEAALLGMNIAPGLLRRFDSEKWSSINGALWKAARAKAEAAVRPNLAAPIFGSDADPDAVELAIRAAKLAGVAEHIRFDEADFRRVPTKAEYGVVITNPPYGVRMGDLTELMDIYSGLPAVFAGLPTWSFHLLSAKPDLERLFGRAADKRRKLFNADIECQYFTFYGPKPLDMRRELAASVAAPQTVAVVEHSGLESASASLDEHAGIDAAMDQEPAQRIENLDEVAQASEPTDVEPECEDTDDSVTSHVDDSHDPADSDQLADSEDSDDFQSAPTESTQPQASIPLPAARPSAEIAAFAAFAGLRERDTREAAEFGRALANNLRHLRRYPTRGINAYRVYERDYPEVPLIIDRYLTDKGEYFHAVEYEREHSRDTSQQGQWYSLMQRTIAEVAEVRKEQVIVKPKPRQRDGVQFTRISDESLCAVVLENGLKLGINLSDYIDTGLFVDHRLTRAMVGRECAGKRVLNLFCYTGAFTVHAAAGGATRTVSVDLSHTYLDWAEANLRLNNLHGGAHDLVRADVLEFLRQHQRPNAQSAGYELAIVDPPTFSNSKATQEDWQVAESQGDLFSALVPLMAPGGIIYFSNNYRRFKLDEELMAQLGLSYREISHQTVPPEHRNRRIHRCWRMTVAQ